MSPDLLTKPGDERMARVETLLEIVSRDVKEMKDAQATQIREIQAQKMDRTEFNLINSEYLKNQVEMEEATKSLAKTVASLVDSRIEFRATVRAWILVGGACWSVFMFIVGLYINNHIHI